MLEKYAWWQHGFIYNLEGDEGMVVILKNE